MSVYCSRCGREHKDSSAVCQHCGNNIENKIAYPGSLLKKELLLDNRYEIKGLIKSGGMGAVYEGLDHKFEKKPCAIKELLLKTSSPEEQEYLIERFKKEAQLLHDLRHTNLPVVKDWLVENGRYYLVMDYIEGKDLYRVMNEHKHGIPEHLVIEWSKELLNVIDYLHNQNPPVIYRDLKPGNIMLRTDGKILLVDFGIARKVWPEKETEMTIAGTLTYAPKELFEGKADTRSDIYSLGATMHSLLTGSAPSACFSFKPVREINREISKELEMIVMKALETEKENRYQSAKEMKEAIERLNYHDHKTMSDMPAVPATMPYCADISNKISEISKHQVISSGEPVKADKNHYKLTFPAVLNIYWLTANVIAIMAGVFIYFILHKFNLPKYILVPYFLIIIPFILAFIAGYIRGKDNLFYDYYTVAGLFYMAELYILIRKSIFYTDLDIKTSLLSYVFRFLIFIVTSILGVYTGKFIMKKFSKK